MNPTKPIQNTVRMTKRERRRIQRLQELAKLPTAAAFDKAASIAAAAAHKRQLELERGDKVSRKQRAELMRAMSASVLSAANVGYRIKQGITPTGDMMESAKQQPEALQAEIRAAAEHFPALAQQVAQEAGFENLAAELATVATAASSATPPQQDPNEAAESQNHAAALPSVDTSASSAPPLLEHSTQQRAAIGRPSEFTDTEADRICEWIQSGNSLNAYCKQHGRKASTIYRWLRESVSFRDNYARAHADRADTLVEDMLDIADATEKAADIVDVMQAKLRIETRKWIAERMRPEKYGNKLQVEHKQPVTFNLGVSRAKQEVTVEPKPVQIDLDKA